MEQSKKISRKVISLVLSLLMVLSCFSGMGLTAFAAETTVTWNASDITKDGGNSTSFTKGGITITGDKISYKGEKNFAGPGAFTTELGKFTKIEVTAKANIISGTGWSGDSSKMTWTGDASDSVSYTGTISGPVNIVFTIETADATHSVTITPGSNMTKTETSGAASQTGLSGAMTDVVYTANDGYMFPVESNSYGTSDGITVTRTNDTCVTVSGTPTGVVNVTIPDAVPIPHTHDDITFTAWESTNSLPTDGGNYYLTNDVKLDNTWYAPNGAINLCLDGHSITAAEGKEIQLMDVENGATLNLYDKEDNSGSVSGAVSVNGAILVNSGTFNMYGGTIKDNMTTDHGAGVRVKYGGTFSLYGGSIENNKTKNPGGNGGGVHVESNSTFNMSGGSIKNNTAFASAGVFIGTNCTFNMSGGSITGNIATNGYGGVLFTDDGTATFKLSGDVTISDNVTKINIDEIDVHETHPSNMVFPDSMKIEVVDALTGEGKIYVQIGTSRVFTNSTGSVKAKDYIDKFVSDSATYRIKTEGDELRIEAPYLRVGGTFVYDDNAADVFKDGKVKFTPANETTTYATLTLNGYQYDGTGDDDSDGIIYLDAAQLRIVLKGENVVKATNPGIMINRQLDTIISSENGGSLEVVSELGDAIYANGALTVESGTISATGSNRGIAANGINLSGGKIVAAGTGERGYGIYCDNPPWMPDNSISINSGISSLIASGTLGAVYGNVANALEGLGWSNITGTDGQETIAVAAEARSLEYKKVAFVSHTHSFTYSASGATITATCSADDCTLTDSKATLTIAAPDNLTYDTNAKAAVITDANAIQGTAKVQYQTKNGSTYGEATETAPTNAGTYKASITVGGATASVEYTIAKADPTCTAPTGLTATYGQTLADVTLTNPSGNTAGTWAWVDDTTSVGNVGTKTFKANFTPTDSVNYKSVSDIDVTVKVNKAANPATVATTASVVRGGRTVDLSNNVTMNGATGNVGYEIVGEAKGCTLDGSVLTSGTVTGTVNVKVTVAADDNYNALEEKTITVTINDKEQQNITVSDVTATYGETGASVSATTDGDGAITYAVKKGEDCIDIDENTGAITTKKAGTALVVVYAAETDTYNEESAKVLVTINKATPTITAENKTSKAGEALAKLTYKVDGTIVEGDDLGIKLSTNANAAVAGKYDIKVEYTENENYDVTVVNGVYTVTSVAPATTDFNINNGFKATSNNKGITTSWAAIPNADKIEIYAAYCTKGGKFKKIKTLKGNATSFKIKKLGGKKLNKKKAVKIYIVAYRLVNGKYVKIAKSITLHVAGTKSKKYTNAKAIKVKNSEVTLNVNQTSAIKAKLVLKNKKKKALKHAAKFRYQSSNKAVATVDENGKITAKGKGTCYILIIANNGNLKSVKVTVK